MLRPIAIAVDIVLIATAIGLHATVAPESESVTLAPHTPGLTKLAVNGAHIALIFAATKKWLNAAAQTYSMQLVAARDTLGKDNDGKKI
jgi:hypothetical protein